MNSNALNARRRKAIHALAMRGPKFCSMKITQDVRAFVAAGNEAKSPAKLEERSGVRELVANEEKKKKDAA